MKIYNKHHDQAIPWKTFDDAIKALSRFKQEYSKEASATESYRG
ncbi:hemolysin E [Escherichia coli]